MTGWRLGYAIVPPEFVRPMQKLQQNFFIAANTFVQWAGVAALTDPDARRAIDGMVATYDERRRFIVPRIREIGLGVAVEPTGAFYVLANATRFTTDSLAFAQQLLEERGVAVTPGIDFGPGAEGYLRFTYANSLENIVEGLNRLEAFLAERPAS